MEEQQALFNEITLADGSTATKAEIQLIDLITQEAKKYREETIKLILRFSPQITPELQEEIKELPTKYKFFLNSKTGTQLIKMLGGADLALELIQAKPQTPKRKIYPLAEIQQFFWIIYYVIVYTPEELQPSATDIIGDALNELHLEKAKNPWAKLCQKATNAKLCDALATIINTHFEKIKATQKASPELLKTAEMAKEALNTALKDFKTASTATTKNTAAKKIVMLDNVINKTMNTPPKKDKNSGQYERELEVIGTALPEKYKTNHKTNINFLAKQINKRIILLIPETAKKEIVTPADFLNIDDKEIISYVSGKVLKTCADHNWDTTNIQGLPLIPITPTEIYRALYRNPQAKPTKEALQKIIQEIEKMNSGIECRVDDEDEAKITKQKINTTDFLPVLKYHKRNIKVYKATEGQPPRTEITYYYTAYVSPFIEYVLKKGYYTTIDMDKTTIYELTEDNQISTKIAQMGSNRIKVISYLESRILNYNLKERTIKIDTIMEATGITDRKERTRAVGFIPTILANFKNNGYLTDYKIKDDKINYSIPRDTKNKKTAPTQKTKNNPKA